MKKLAEKDAKVSSVSHDSNISKSVFLQKEVVPGILQWASSCLEPGVSVSEHVHEDATEIFHLQEGSMLATINNEFVHLEKGDLLVIEPGERHAFTNQGSEPCRFIYALIKSP